MVSEKRLSLESWGREVRFHGFAQDRTRPYYDALAYRFLESFIANTPQNSVAAFVLCNLAEDDKLYPVDKNAGRAAKFPPRERLAYQAYQRKMAAKRKPHIDERDRLGREITKLEGEYTSEQRHLMKIKKDKKPEDYTDEEKAEISAGEAILEGISKKLDPLQTRKRAKIDLLDKKEFTNKYYSNYYTAGKTDYRPGTLNAEENMAARVHPQDWQDLAAIARKRAEINEGKAEGITPHFHENIRAMAADLGLTDNELRLIILLDTLQNVPFLDELIAFGCDGKRETANMLLGRLIGVSTEEMERLIGPESPLRKQGLIEYHAPRAGEHIKLLDIPHFSQLYNDLLRQPNNDYASLKKQLFGAEQKTDLKWPEDFDYVDAQFHETLPNEIAGFIAQKKRFLSGDTKKEPGGLPYMMVGPTRSGKSEAAIALAEKCGMKAILIGQNLEVIDANGKKQTVALSDAERISQVKAAINKYKNATDVILILDEFDSLFPKNEDYYGDKDSKAPMRFDTGAERSEFQDLIKNSGLPMIFTSNVDPSKVHRAVVARMEHVISVEMPDAKSRRRIALRRLSDYGVAVEDAEGNVTNADLLKQFGHDDPQKYTGTITASDLDELARYEVMSGEVSEAIRKACTDAEGNAERTGIPQKVDHASLDKHFVMIANQNHSEVSLSPLEDLYEDSSIADAEPAHDFPFDKYNIEPSTPLKVAQAVAGYTEVPDNKVRGVVIEGPGDKKTTLAQHIITRMDLAGVVVTPKQLPKINRSQFIDEVFRKAKADRRAVIFTEEEKARVVEKADDKGVKTKISEGGFDEATLQTITDKATQHRVFTALVLNNILSDEKFTSMGSVFNFSLISHFLKKTQLEYLFEDKTGVKPEEGTFNGLKALTERDLDTALQEAHTFGADEFKENKSDFQYLRKLLEARNRQQGEISPPKRYRSA